MSCFVGRMNEYERISLDRFDSKNLQSTVYFLSHLHEDHTVGLGGNIFFKRLKSNKNIVLYCSEVTEVLLLASQKYRHLAPYIKSISINTPTTIDIPDPLFDEKDKVTVTFLPAFHCPGSVMCLFEGHEGTVIYSGDFRWEHFHIEQMHHLRSAESVKRIKSLYVDSTFCTPENLYIPSRQQCIDAVYYLIHEWITQSPQHVVYIKLRAQYGHEPLLNAVAARLNMKVHVSQHKVDVYDNVLEFQGNFTSDGASTQIHACGDKQAKIDKDGEQVLCRQSHAADKVLVILPTTMYFTQFQHLSLDMIVKRIDSNFYRACYSFHSSYTEIMDLLAYLKPDKVFPNVKPPTDDSLAMTQHRLNTMLKECMLSGAGDITLPESVEEVKQLGKLKVRKGKAAEKRKTRVPSSDSESLDFGTPSKLRRQATSPKPDTSQSQDSGLSSKRGRGKGRGRGKVATETMSQPGTSTRRSSRRLAATSATADSVDSPQITPKKVERSDRSLTPDLFLTPSKHEKSDSDVHSSYAGSHRSDSELDLTQQSQSSLELGASGEEILKVTDTGWSAGSFLGAVNSGSLDKTGSGCVCLLDDEEQTDENYQDVSQVDDLDLDVSDGYSLEELGTIQHDVLDAPKPEAKLSVSESTHTDKSAILTGETDAEKIIDLTSVEDEENMADEKRDDSVAKCKDEVDGAGVKSGGRRGRKGKRGGRGRGKGNGRGVVTVDDRTVDEQSTSIISGSEKDVEDEDNGEVNKMDTHLDKGPDLNVSSGALFKSNVSDEKQTDEEKDDNVAIVTNSGTKNSSTKRGMKKLFKESTPEVEVIDLSESVESSPQMEENLERDSVTALHMDSALQVKASEEKVESSEEKVEANEEKTLNYKTDSDSDIMEILIDDDESDNAEKHVAEGKAEIIENESIKEGETAGTISDQSMMKQLPEIETASELNQHVEPIRKNEEVSKPDTMKERSNERKVQADEKTKKKRLEESARARVGKRTSSNSESVSEQEATDEVKEEITIEQEVVEPVEDDDDLMDFAVLEVDIADDDIAQAIAETISDTEAEEDDLSPVIPAIPSETVQVHSDTKEKHDTQLKNSEISGVKLQYSVKVFESEFDTNYQRSKGEEGEKSQTGVKNSISIKSNSPSVHESKKKSDGVVVKKEVKKLRFSRSNSFGDIVDENDDASEFGCTQEIPSTALPDPEIYATKWAFCFEPKKTIVDEYEKFMEIISEPVASGSGCVDAFTSEIENNSTPQGKVENFPRNTNMSSIKRNKKDKGKADSGSSKRIAEEMRQMEVEIDLTGDDIFVTERVPSSVSAGENMSKDANVSYEDKGGKKLMRISFSKSKNKTSDSQKLKNKNDSAKESVTKHIDEDKSTVDSTVKKDIKVQNETTNQTAETDTNEASNKNIVNADASNVELLNKITVDLSKTDKEEENVNEELCISSSGETESSEKAKNEDVNEESKESGTDNELEVHVVSSGETEKGKANASLENELSEDAVVSLSDGDNNDEHIEESKEVEMIDKVNDENKEVMEVESSQEWLSVSKAIETNIPDHSSRKRKKTKDSNESNKKRHSKVGATENASSSKPLHKPGSSSTSKSNEKDENNVLCDENDDSENVQTADLSEKDIEERLEVKRQAMGFVCETDSDSDSDESAPPPSPTGSVLYDEYIELSSDSDSDGGKGQDKKDKTKQSKDNVQNKSGNKEGSSSTGWLSSRNRGTTDSNGDASEAEATDQNEINEDDVDVDSDSSKKISPSSKISGSKSDEEDKNTENTRAQYRKHSRNYREKNRDNDESIGTTSPPGKSSVAHPVTTAPVSLPQPGKEISSLWRANRVSRFEPLKKSSQQVTGRFEPQKKSSQQVTGRYEPQKKSSQQVTDYSSRFAPPPPVPPPYYQYPYGFALPPRVPYPMGVLPPMGVPSPMGMPLPMGVPLPIIRPPMGVPPPTGYQYSSSFSVAHPTSVGVLPPTSLSTLTGKSSTRMPSKLWQSNSSSGKNTSKSIYGSLAKTSTSSYNSEMAKKILNTSLPSSLMNTDISKLRASIFAVTGITDSAPESSFSSNMSVSATAASYSGIQNSVTSLSQAIQGGGIFSTQKMPGEDLATLVNKLDEVKQLLQNVQGSRKSQEGEHSHSQRDSHGDMYDQERYSGRRPVREESDLYDDRRRRPGDDEYRRMEEDRKRYDDYYRRRPPLRHDDPYYDYPPHDPHYDYPPRDPHYDYPPRDPHYDYPPHDPHYDYPPRDPHYEEWLLRRRDGSQRPERHPYPHDRIDDRYPPYDPDDDRFPPYDRYSQPDRRFPPDGDPYYDRYDQRDNYYDPRDSSYPPHEQNHQPRPLSESAIPKARALDPMAPSHITNEGSSTDVISQPQIKKFKKSIILSKFDFSPPEKKVIRTAIISRHGKITSYTATKSSVPAAQHQAPQQTSPNPKKWDDSMYPAFVTGILAPKPSPKICENTKPIILALEPKK